MPSDVVLVATATGIFPDALGRPFKLAQKDLTLTLLLSAFS